MLCLSGFEIYSRWVPLPFGKALTFSLISNRVILTPRKCRQRALVSYLINRFFHRKATPLMPTLLLTVC